MELRREEAYFGFPPLQDTLQLISKLDEKQFQALLDEVVSPAGFNRDLARCESLAKRLQASLETSGVFHLLASLRFLYDRCRDWEKSQRDTEAALNEFLEVTGLRRKLGDPLGPGYDRLIKLTEKNSAVERQRKIRWLRTGILDTAVDFASFVDIRPRISDDRKKIEELIPIVIFRVMTESEVGQDKAHVFQLTKEGVFKLRAVVEDIENKLAAVSDDPSLGPGLHAAVTHDKE